MKELKFRAWDTLKEEWYGESNENTLTFKGFYLFGECMYFCAPPVSYIQNLIVEQFIGLKDLNGVDIYEGDIIKMETSISGKLRTIIGEVVYKSRRLEFVIQCENFSKKITAIKHLKVIGNIHKDADGIKKTKSYEIRKDADGIKKTKSYETF